MGYFEEVIALLNGRFPGQFVCRPGTQGRASGLEVRCPHRDGYAFIYEPSRASSRLLALHEADDDENAEVWSPSSPDECVEYLLPWAFPQEWTPPEPVDRQKETDRLAKISAELATRVRMKCQITDPAPNLFQILTAEERQAFDRDLASLNMTRLKQNFPGDSTGRLALNTSVLLNTYPASRLPARGRILSLAAVGPKRRRDEPLIRIELAALIPINQTHRWHDHPWMWQQIQPPDLLGIPTREETTLEEKSLQLLDQGKIEEALSLYGVTLSDDLHRLLGGQRIKPPACCAHADASWTDLLISTLRQSAPWLLAKAVAHEAERIHRCTGRSLGEYLLSWKLAIFPGQFHARKASLMLIADDNDENPQFVIEATGSNARLAETSWKRPIEVDFHRYGVQPIAST